MSVSAVNALPATNAYADTFSDPKSALNQTDFLKLLVAQIQYQDPMNPQSDSQMAAQLAQFTSLQQTTQSAAALAMLQANSLVGNTVTVKVDAKTTATGVVTGVVVSNGAPQVTVGGVNYDLGQILAVEPAPAAATGASGTNTSGTQDQP